MGSRNQAASRPGPGIALVLRLYVSTAAPSSSRAIVNTRAFCEEHAAGHYELEVLDISERVVEATADQVVAVPTLLRLWPLPVRRFIGDMSDPGRLREGLGLPAAPQAKEQP
ncbi:circadian clock KaiB family protein [Ramlibacter pinisoli]|uniref:circadian clock KaiB family protein n=1 Tax=Ramlibacter pinisoli TaxID=2682844 RepID=UPI0012F8E03E|nr:circadian clock KaiB family protein [Ramlibacter pinisoli]